MFQYRPVASAVLVLLTGLPLFVYAHGDVTPQAVDTEGLPQLGEEWTEQNPFRTDDKLHPVALEIGKSAYTQNCARCHGLEVISGGIAPDLRYLEENLDGDEWFKERVTKGAVRDGKVYMPSFSGVISQEGLWAIRTYIDSRGED
ncbi:MAG: cytochrome c-550 PedF [Sedimenticola thiotaurini]|uniref:Cytochrome c-550 PedF n=1 Tax=Sedimenticola thiotaurini TaxID=1543721 RepID=A0A558D6P5_9GAMM|nr:MAG: cytochrome c-550 PedF [Sedimenticola thiotaurini]